MEEVVLNKKDIQEASLEGDPVHYHLPELKQWLKCHGQSEKVSLRVDVKKIRRSIAIMWSGWEQMV